MNIDKFIASSRDRHVYLPGGCMVPNPTHFPRPSRTRPALRVLNEYDYYGAQCPILTKKLRERIRG